MTCGYGSKPMSSYLWEVPLIFLFLDDTCRWDNWVQLACEEFGLYQAISFFVPSELWETVTYCRPLGAIISTVSNVSGVSNSITWFLLQCFLSHEGRGLEHPDCRRGRSAMGQCCCGTRDKEPGKHHKIWHRGIGQFFLAGIARNLTNTPLSIISTR